jgi:hypothetical protein
MRSVRQRRARRIGATSLVRNRLSRRRGYPASSNRRPNSADPRASLKPPHARRPYFARNAETTARNPPRPASDSQTFAHNARDLAAASVAALRATPGGLRAKVAEWRATVFASLPKLVTFAPNASNLALRSSWLANGAAVVAREGRRLARKVPTFALGLGSSEREGEDAGGSMAVAANWPVTGLIRRPRRGLNWSR